MSDRWAVEARALKGEETSTSETVSSRAIGLRGYRYFRPPSRARLFVGGEVAATQSESNMDAQRTNGVAVGAFGGLEVYLFKGLSLGADTGPYLLASRVRNQNTSGNDVTMVMNVFMNLYFL